MEVSVEEELAIRRFLQEFNKECRLSPTGDDGVQLRGGIVSSYRLLPEDVLPEVMDWVLYYMEQRKSPPALADFLARDVAETISKSLMSIRHSNGTAEGSDKETLIDSLQLYSEVMDHLHGVCNHLRDSDDSHAILTEANLSRVSYPVSVCGIKNTRRRMEDRHVIIHDLGTFCGVEDEMHSSYYAVFDGHGGVDAANYAASHLHRNIVQHPLYLTDLSTAMKDSFKTTDQDFLDRCSRDGIKSGCTAICCIVRNHVLYMAWVGDSQAIIVRQGMPILCMEIHKPERQDERQRIEEMGGSVTYQDGWRVNNAVGVSRAIGDPEYKKWISSDADVCSIPLNGTEDFLVVACDGLWDSMSPSDVTAVVYHHIVERTKDIDSVATQLVHHAKDQGSRDNISAILVFLRDPASLAMQAMSPHLSDALNMEQAKKHNGNFQYLESNGTQIFDGLADKSENLKKTLENNYFDESYGNPFASGQSSAAVGGTVPEKTAYSELPTPPIEDVLLSDEFMIHNVPGSISDTRLETEQSKTTEIASDIVNAAIEAAVEICAFGSDSVPEVASSVESHLNEFAQVPISNTKENMEYLIENGDVKQPFIDNQEICSANMMEMIDVDVVDSSKAVDQNAMFRHQSNPFLQDAQQVLLDSNVAQQMKDPISEHQTSVQSATMDPMAAFEPADLEKYYSTVVQQVSLDVNFTEQVKVPSPEHDSQPSVQVATMESMSAFEAGDFEKYDSGMMFLQDQQKEVQNRYVPDHLESSSQPSQSELFFSGQAGFMQAQGTSPFGISECVPNDTSEMLEENPFLSAPDSLLLYGGLNLGNLEPSNNLFSLSEEAPSAVRSLQGVPEMLGISESVPGRKSPEVVSVNSPEKTSFGIVESIPGDSTAKSPFVDIGKMQDGAGTFMDAPSARSPFDGMEKSPSDAFLDASLDNLRSLGTEQGGGDQTPLGLKSLSTMMEAMSLQEQMSYSQPEKQDEPKVDEHFSFLDEMTKPEIQENVTPAEPPKVEESLPEVQKEKTVELLIEPTQVSNTSSETGEIESLNAKELAVDIIAKVLPDEMPTPEVVVDSIPENVPEADGVTEDSDSEKDGGWKYVSGTKQLKKDSKATGAATEVQPTQKEERPQADTVKRVKAAQSSSNQTTRKPLGSKSATEAKISATQKQPASAQVTMRKAPLSLNKTIIQTKPLASKATSSITARMPKTAPSTKTTSTLRPTTAPSDATKPATGASRTTSSVASRPKTAATSTTGTSTMQKPTSTVIRKSKPVGTTDATPKLPSSTAASTLQPRRPSPATAAKTPTPRTATSTLPAARLQVRKPLPNGSEAASSKPTKIDKPIASNTIRQARPLSTKAPASNMQAKETKETVNKEISKMPSPLKGKPVASSTLPNTRKLPQNGVKSASAKPPTPTSPPKKQLSPIKKSGTPVKDTAPTKNSPSKSVQKPIKRPSPSADAASESKSEKEKGSLEENTKETKAVDSGVASPESPVSPQLSNIEMGKESVGVGQCTNEEFVEQPELIQQ